MNKKYWILIVVIILIIAGLVWYFNQSVFSVTTSPEALISSPEKPVSSLPQDENESWKEFSNESVGISFSYPMDWGIPKVSTEGDVYYYDENNQFKVSKGQFFITFPSSHPSVSIEGLNASFISDDPYSSCAWSNLVLNNNKKKLQFKTTPINYSVNIGEGENRFGLFGDVILNSNIKYPSICATIYLGEPAHGYTYESKDLSRVVSEQLSSGHNSEAGFIRDSYYKDLSSEYLKGLNSDMKKNIENFEKFANSLKAI